MTDFFKKFLIEDPRRTGSGGKYAGLGAFGKHPGWDDHVEDLGLETGSLTFAKTALYINGIGGQIDSGAWEKLDAAQQLPGFKHLFLWQRSGQILVGRLWSSSDGKGRKRYPMVVCFHFAGVSLGWALQHALPALAELEEGCLRATSAEEVRGLLDAKRAVMREAIQTAGSNGEYAPVTPEALHRILHPVGDANSEGFVRVLYRIQSELQAFAPGVFSARGAAAANRAQQIRGPAGSPDPEQAFLFWTRLLLTQVDPAVPLLLILPLGENWVDVTVGEPESREFFCLRASPKAVPLVSEVPYTMDEAFRAKAVKFLSDFKQGDTTAKQIAPAVAAAAEAPSEGGGGWLKWLALVVILGLGAIALLKFGPKSWNQPAAPNTAGPGSNALKTAASPDAVATAGAPAVVSNADLKQDAADAAAARLAAEKKRSDDIAAEGKRKADEAAKLVADKKRADELAATAKIKADAAAAEETKRQAEATRLATEKKHADEIAAEERKKADEAAKAVAAQAQAETARVAAARKQAEDAAAAKVKAESAAQEQKQAEAARLKKEKDALVQTEAQSAKAAEDARLKAARAATRMQIAAVGDSMTNSIGMVLVLLPSKIWAAKYEVTQAEYTKVMGANPSASQGETQPVEQVSWNDAVAFSSKLSELDKAQLPAGAVYTLPTEQQWQDMAGGQKSEDLPGPGLTAKGKPMPVGQTGPANKYGLYDVLGNVREWCLDGGTEGKRLQKGGAFDDASLDRAAPPDAKSPNCGFRCVIAVQ